MQKFYGDLQSIARGQAEQVLIDLMLPNYQTITRAVGMIDLAYDNSAAGMDMRSLTVF